MNALRVQVQGLQAKVKSHRTAVSEQNELRADMEALRQRNIKLDSELESHREENDRLTRENNILSAGLSWGEKADVAAKAETAQLTPPPPGIVAQTASAQLLMQTDREENVAGPSQPSISMDTMTQAMLPLLQDNISQMVTAAVRAQAGESAAADKAHIAQLQQQLQQLSRQTLVPPSSTGGHLPPQDMRQVAKAMQSSPAELEQMLPLPVGFTPLRLSEPQPSTSVAGSVESDGTGVQRQGSPGTPATITKIVKVVKDDTKTDTPTPSVTPSHDDTPMETETDTDAPTVSDPQFDSVG